MDLIIEEKGAVSIINIHLADRDIDCLLRYPHAMIGSDGFTMNMADPMGLTGHPRWFGTFPRILGEYARKRHVISLEEAIRKMTELPAQRFVLRRRGQIKQGFHADLVVFDPAEVQDTATYEKPATPPLGIKYVMVNGRIAFQDRQLTGSRCGVVLLG